jgi:hypothetical protein
MTVSNGPTVPWKVRILGTGKTTQIDQSFVHVSQSHHLMDEPMFVDVIARGPVRTSHGEDAVNVRQRNGTTLTTNLHGTLGEVLQVGLQSQQSLYGSRDAQELEFLADTEWHVGGEPKGKGSRLVDQSSRFGILE